MSQYEDDIAKFEVEILNGTNNVAEALLDFIEKIKKTGNTERLVESYFLLTKYYLTRELNKERVAFYLDKLNEHSAYLTPFMQAKILRLKGYSAYNHQDLKMSLGYFTESISILEKLPQTEKVIIELGENYVNLSLLQKSSKQSDVRKEFFRKALLLFEQVNYHFGIGKCQNALANIHFELGELAAAVELYQYAFDSHVKANNLQGQAVVLNNMGTCYVQEGKTEEAIFTLEKSLELKLLVGNPHQIANSYIHFGDVYFTISDFKKALINYSLAKDICLKHNIKIELNAIYLKIAESYEELGDFKNSIDYLKLHLLLANDVREFEKNKEVSELMLKFEMNKREEETVFLRKQKVEIDAYVQKLEESNNELRQFAHITSHDLREPLRMIGGYVGLIEKRLSSLLKDDEKEYLQYITKGVKRMDELIRDILTYTKLNQPLEFKPIDLNLILEGVLSNLTSEINKRSAFVSYEKLPFIHADSSQMTQLFQNLIGNSIKYNTSSSPSISITTNGMKIRIEDNGIGIAAEHRETVFEIFNRLHPEHKFSGTGMGLAICKKIMNRIGGSIHIEDASLGGVCFVLVFPE